jgi:hypothetical protein
MQFIKQVLPRFIKPRRPSQKKDKKNMVEFSELPILILYVAMRRDEGPSLETSTFSLYFSGSCIQITGEGKVLDHRTLVPEHFLSSQKMFPRKNLRHPIFKSLFLLLFNYSTLMVQYNTILLFKRRVLTLSGLIRLFASVCLVNPLDGNVP